MTSSNLFKDIRLFLEVTCFSPFIHDLVHKHFRYLRTILDDDRNMLMSLRVIDFFFSWIRVDMDGSQETILK